jgi:hypothetical protein
MSTMTNWVLMLMMRFSKGNAIIGEYPVSIVILFIFGGGYGFEKS